MPLLAFLVLLTFIDCVGNSGCHGCVNIRFWENRGSPLSQHQLARYDHIWLSPLPVLQAANRRARFGYVQSGLKGFPINFQRRRRDCQISWDVPEETPTEFTQSQIRKKHYSSVFRRKVRVQPWSDCHYSGCTFLWTSSSWDFRI